MYTPPEPVKPVEPWSFAMSNTLDHAEAVEELGNRLAAICTAVNISPILGRLYAVIYLSHEAVSLDELREALGTAKSTASVSIRKLLETGAVKRERRADDRRDYYALGASLGTVVHDWVQASLRREVAALGELARGIGRELDTPRGDGWPDATDREVLAARLEATARFAATREASFRAVTDDAPSSMG
jgi:DNA-binding transcriptional regulator GbsR (MarR family)